jgi:hypothetical protein
MRSDRRMTMNKTLTITLSSLLAALIVSCQGSVSVIPTGKNEMYYVRSNGLGSDTIEHCTIGADSKLSCKKVSIKLEYRFVNSDM